MEIQVYDLIETAKNELGYQSIDIDNYNIEVKTESEKSRNYNKYAHYLEKNYNDFYKQKEYKYNWCDLFIDYCFIKTFGLDKALKLICQYNVSIIGGCNNAYKCYKDCGRVGTIPRVGSQLFNGVSFSSIYNTSIVERYDSNYVYTIEASSPDNVMRRIYRLDATNLFGYGYPNYGDLSLTMNYDTFNPLKDLTWGTYRVSKKLNNNAIFTGKIVVKNAAIRTWAGKNYSKIRSIPYVQYGREIDVLDWVKSEDGEIWYYIKIDNSKVGFIYSKYVCKI